MQPDETLDCYRAIVTDTEPLFRAACAENNTINVHMHGKRILYACTNYIDRARHARRTWFGVFGFGPKTLPDTSLIQHYVCIAASASQRMQEHTPRPEPVHILNNERTDELRAITNQLEHTGVLLSVVQTVVQQGDSAIEQLNTDLHATNAHVDRSRDALLQYYPKQTSCAPESPLLLLTGGLIGATLLLLVLL